MSRFFTWRSSQPVLGPADYIDAFPAPVCETAMNVAAIVRTVGHATTDIRCAAAWKEIPGRVGDMPAGEFLMEPTP